MLFRSFYLSFPVIPFPTWRFSHLILSRIYHLYEPFYHPFWSLFASSKSLPVSAPDFHKNCLFTSILTFSRLYLASSSLYGTLSIQGRNPFNFQGDLLTLIPRTLVLYLTLRLLFLLSNAILSHLSAQTESSNV